jgi:hypothetical protein
MKFLVLLPIAFLMACGSTTDRQTKTVETKVVQTQPAVISTPTGPVTIPAMTFEERRVVEEVEQSKTAMDAPEIGAVVKASVAAAMGDFKGALQEIRAASPATGIDLETGGLGGLACGAMLLALREWAAHRATKKDSDEAWDKLIARADGDRA